MTNIQKGRHFLVKKYIKYNLETISDVYGTNTIIFMVLTPSLFFPKLWKCEILEMFSPGRISSTLKRGQENSSPSDRLICMCITAVVKHPRLLPIVSMFTYE